MIQTIRDRMSTLQFSLDKESATVLFAVSAINKGCSPFMELAQRKMRDTAIAKAYRLRIKLEMLEEILEECDA